MVTGAAREQDERDMEGKTALVTGGSSGVGFAVARGLARRGARVVLVSRSVDRGGDAAERIAAETGSDLLNVVTADLTNPYSVRLLGATLFDQFDALDVFVSAAGAIAPTGLTEQGVPHLFTINYLAHYWTFCELLPALAEAESPRALFVGASPVLSRQLRGVPMDRVPSTASAPAVIAQSLAWKLLLMRFASSQLEGGPATTVFYPGLIRSKLLTGRGGVVAAIGSVANRFAKDEVPVAERLATASDTATFNGRAVDTKGRTVRLHPSLDTAQNAEAVWEASARITEEITSQGRMTF